ncbi:MAG: hypothetical protein J6T57_02815, partial [Alphaproteobacteria bacterium]|nr:hypothetical protein [Alphaproteobacteria bacterium]
MKKIIFAICMVCSGAAFALNEESVTSREYVDAGLGAKQDTLTTTGTGAMTFDSSETDGVGQKPIYNPNGDYAAQADALVTAGVSNAAIQNAIAAEFVCIAWKNDDPNDECLLVQIKNAVNRSKNLFDVTKSKIARLGVLQSDGGYFFQQPANITCWGIQGPVAFNGEENTRYTLSAEIKTSGPFYPGVQTGVGIGLGFYYTDNTFTRTIRGFWDEYTPVSVVSTAGKTVKGICAVYYRNETLFVKNIQITEGTTV